MTMNRKRLAASRGALLAIGCMLAALLAVAPAIAQSVIVNNPGRKPVFAIRNATIYPVTRPRMANRQWTIRSLPRHT